MTDETDSTEDTETELKVDSTLVDLLRPFGMMGTLCAGLGVIATIVGIIVGLLEIYDRVTRQGSEGDGAKEA